MAMVAGIESGPQPAGPAFAADEFLPPGAIGALQSHPRFHEAVRVAIAGLIEMYGRNRLLNRVMNDRGRAMGSMIALYLHFCPMEGDKRAGLTVGRFQALCRDMKICSPGRAWALLAMLRFEGYLAPEPGASDRRQHRLVPTSRLIELHLQRWRCQFRAMALVMPEGHMALEVHRRPEFMAVFLRHLGASYLAGFRLLDYAPDLARLSEGKAGLLVISSLFLSAADGPTPGGTAVPISISALSMQFGIARAHARKLLASAADTGLVRRTDRGDTLIVLPRLVLGVNNYFAALFVLLAHCARATAEEIETASLVGPVALGPISSHASRVADRSDLMRLP